ncbi:polyhydroxyalkanoate biosynthesis repressor PhaR [Psychrobacillus sp. FSL H8-0483]|uniref:polyhydroxyalkanoate biosynthesis repressor PhaR n=1 Tax=Psychrobacillus sp. FSL H8-0483 TaxID=2921389 RepID=UPI00315A0FAA
MRLLTKPLPFDPFTMWKTFYEQTEANWTSAIHETLKKESFSEGMGETLNYYLQAQELKNDTTESFLKSVNMPTRSEVADIASLIINVESKLDTLDDRFDEEMNQLIKAVSNLDEKLDKILELLSN